MDPKTFSLAVALVVASISMLTSFYAAFRKERGLAIIAVGYYAAVLGFALLRGQGVLPRALCFVLANLLIVFYQLSLAWGLRCRLGVSPSWPSRFWLYLSAWFAVLVVASLLLDSYRTRSAFASAFLIVAAAEFLIALHGSSSGQPAAVRRLSFAVALLFSVIHAVRIALLLAYANGPEALMEASFVNAYTFAFALVFAVMWAGLVLIIDATDILTQLEHRSEVFRSLATTDELTGLNNRHSMDARIDSETERSARYGAPLSIIMMDVDHFKRVNDTWGHDAGDEVLKRIAAIVVELVREPDSVYRWGGEEIIVLAPHTPLDGAVTLAEKLRKAIAAEAFPWAGTVTASFGAAEFLPGEGVERWFKRADQAMYRAKNTGRDKVVAFGPEDEIPVARVSVPWRAEWESGERLIDDGHRRLLDRANDLLDVSLTGCSRERLLERMDELLSEIRTHFSEEESVLARVGYPDLAAHEGLHRDLIRAAADLRAKSEGEGVDTGLLLDFIVHRVVMDHLVHADTLFFAYTRGPEAHERLG